MSVCVLTHRSLLLDVLNNVYTVFNEKQVTLLIGLDLSTSFDSLSSNTAAAAADGIQRL